MRGRSALRCMPLTSSDAGELATQHRLNARAVRCVFDVATARDGGGVGGTGIDESNLGRGGRAHGAGARAAEGGPCRPAGSTTGQCGPAARNEPGSGGAAGWPDVQVSGGRQVALGPTGAMGRTEVDGHIPVNDKRRIGRRHHPHHRKVSTPLVCGAW